MYNCSLRTLLPFGIFKMWSCFPHSHLLLFVFFVSFMVCCFPVSLSLFPRVLLWPDYYSCSLVFFCDLTTILVLLCSSVTWLLFLFPRVLLWPDYYSCSLVFFRNLTTILVPSCSSVTWLLFLFPRVLLWPDFYSCFLVFLCSSVTWLLFLLPRVLLWPDHSWASLLLKVTSVKR